MIYRFPCGCVGIPADKFDRDAPVLYLEHCEDQQATTHLSRKRRDTRKGAPVAISFSEAQEIVARLDLLVEDGRKLREIKRLLD